MKLLLVDDMKAFLDLQKAFLRRADCHILTASTGLEALKVATKEHPDLILLDIEMPEMNGIEVTRILRNNPKFQTVPIIIISASQRDKDALAAGANRFLPKPIDEKTFYDTILEFIDLKVRHDPRRTTNLTCTFTIDFTTAEGFIRDLSVSGALISIPLSLDLGTNVHLQFKLPLDRGFKNIDVSGIVVRESPGGYGIGFTEWTEGARMFVEDFVREDLRKPS